METKPNAYYNLKLTDEQIEKGAYRGVVGGNWEVTQKITIDYLIKNGLKKENVLLDLGCGPFRNGVAIINYLESGNYYGLDVSADLVKAGYEKEIKPLGLDVKFPKKNVVTNQSFSLGKFKDVNFDVMLAVSLFTHLPKEEFVLAMTKVREKMAPGGKAFVSLFLVDEKQEGSKVWSDIRVKTNPDSDPFHHKLSDVKEVCEKSGWSSVVVGEDPNYPRKQKFVIFTA